MNLNAVYELKERLEISAIAGVNLIEENFRLHRAIEQMAPFAAASPVFKKMNGMCKQLIAPNCPERSGVLLDVLALVNAVLCTQGTLERGCILQDLKAEKECAEVTERTGEILTNIPYSQMAPLLEALQGTGGGRYAVVRDTWDSNAGLFSDYRILKLLVKALGDSYADLADLAAEILKRQGKIIVPLLKQGFCKGGKREMVRRIQVMEAVAGADENAFYCEVLQDAEKDIKEAAILALRHDPDNTELLLALVKSERGRMKEAAKHSLVHMNHEDAIAYWKQNAKKAPEKMVEYLMDSQEDWASDLVADILNQYMDKLEKIQRKGFSMTTGERDELLALWRAAQGKHSEKLCACYERLRLWIPEAVKEVLMDTMMKAPHANLTSLAEKLYEEHGDRYLDSAFLASLMCDTPETVYERFHEYLENRGFISTVTDRRRNPKGIFRLFFRMMYVESEKRFIVSPYSYGYTVRYHESYLHCASQYYVIKQGLDPRWYPLLLHYKGRFSNEFSDIHQTAYADTEEYNNAYDAMVAYLYQPGLEGLDQEYREYFYESITKRGLTIGAVRMLKRHGWMDFHGLFSYCDSSKFSDWKMMELLREMPFDGVELAEELEVMMQKNDFSKTRRSRRLQNWYERLKTGESVKDLW